MTKYLANCFLLLLPVFIWNIALFSRLPKGFGEEIWNNVPSWLNITEVVFRTLAYLMPLLLVFSLQSKTQKIGFGVYLVGLLIYFSSWSMQLYYPTSDWSTSFHTYPLVNRNRDRWPRVFCQYSLHKDRLFLSGNSIYNCAYLSFLFGLQPIVKGILNKVLIKVTSISHSG